MAPADALAERLLKLFPPGRVYTPEALRREGLPRPLLHFIEQALQRRLILEREVLDAVRADSRSPWFDADAAPVLAAWQAYFDALGQTARIPEDEWPHALRQAVRQVTGFLLRPALALTTFVFGDAQGELEVDVIRRRMAYFSSYPYVQEVVASYVRERGLAQLDRKTFAGLLERVERRTPVAYQGQDWDVLLADLFELLGTGENGAVPGTWLAPLFADKGLADVAQVLANHPGPVTREEVVVLLTPAPTQPASTPPVEVSPPAPLKRPPLPPERVMEPAAQPAEQEREPSAPDPVPAPVPGLEAPPKEEPPPAPMTPSGSERPPPPPAPSREDRRPLWQRFMQGREEPADDEGDAGSPRHSRMLELERRALGSIAPAQRQKFVREVFAGDSDAYATALERLVATSTWTEAARTLLDVFQKQGVDLYHPAAVALTDAAEQRFLK